MRSWERRFHGERGPLLAQKTEKNTGEERGGGQVSRRERLGNQTVLNIAVKQVFLTGGEKITHKGSKKEGDQRIPDH